MHRKTIRSTVAVFMTLTLLASACGDDDDDAAETSTEPTAAGEDAPGGDAGSGCEEPTELRLALAHTVLFDTVAFDAVAEDQGFYEEECIEITGREYPAGSGDIIQALVSDSVDVSVAVGMFAVYSALAQDAPIEIASGEWQGNSDLIYYVDPDSEIQSLDDVSGSSVAISRPGSTTDLVCRAMQNEREEAGEEPNECPVIGSPPDIFTAVTTGQIDVGWTTPPFFFEEIDNGTVRQIGTGDDIESLADITTRVGVARSDLVEQDPEGLAAFFRAYERAIDWTYENPEEAAAIWAETAELDNSVDVLVAAIEAYDRDNLALEEISGLEASLDAAVEFDFLEPGALTEEQVRESIVIDRIFNG